MKKIRIYLVGHMHGDTAPFEVALKHIKKLKRLGANVGVLMEEWSEFLKAIAQEKVSRVEEGKRLFEYLANHQNDFNPLVFPYHQYKNKDICIFLASLMCCQSAAERQELIANNKPTFVNENAQYRYCKAISDISAVQPVHSATSAAFSSEREKKGFGINQQAGYFEKSHADYSKTIINYINNNFRNKTAALFVFVGTDHSIPLADELLNQFSYQMLPQMKIEIVPIHAIPLHGKIDEKYRVALPDFVPIMSKKPNQTKKSSNSKTKSSLSSERCQNLYFFLNPGTNSNYACKEFDDLVSESYPHCAPEVQIENVFKNINMDVRLPLFDISRSKAKRIQYSLSSPPSEVVEFEPQSYKPTSILC